MDRILKLTQPKLIKEFNKVKYTVIDEINLIGITKDNIFEPVSQKVKDYVKRKLKEWEELGVMNGYQAVYIKYLAKGNYNYANALEILILGAFLVSRIEEISKDVFLKVAVDIKAQAQKEMPFKIGELDWRAIEKLTVVPSTTFYYLPYLTALFITCSQEIEKQVTSQLQSELPIQLDKLAEKQRKRILSVNEDKFSGVLHDTCVSVGNKVYISPLLKENHKVRFVAIMDKKTTDMCISLDGQIFNTVDENTFTRFTDSQGMTEITVKGLVSGVNLPPITDFVHHCRSFIIYEDTGEVY